MKSNWLILRCFWLGIWRETFAWPTSTCTMLWRGQWWDLSGSQFSWRSLQPRRTYRSSSTVAGPTILSTTVWYARRRYVHTGKKHIWFVKKYLLRMNTHPRFLFPPKCCIMYMTILLNVLKTKNLPSKPVYWLSRKSCPFFIIY